MATNGVEGYPVDKASACEVAGTSLSCVTLTSAALGLARQEITATVSATAGVPLTQQTRGNDQWTTSAAEQTSVASSRFCSAISLTPPVYLSVATRKT